ncbi:MAG: NADH:flavin oxidoreductase [Candidatus Methanoperedens sp.]|nr:NADH:flavin oxidoreductase [Candidatus Methanoperedens sp.]
MGLNKVLEPLNIGGITLPNRIVFPAFQTNLATPEGFVTGRLLRMYRNIAEGGSGMIITGCIAVSDDGAPATNVMRIKSEEHAARLKELFTAIRKNGAVPAVQLMHAGRQTLSAITGHPLVAPSAIPCPVMKETPVELDGNGIERIQDDFAKAAIRAKKAGAGLIELHGAFGYLIGGFLSPYSNKRRDRYGKDKALFFTEIIEKIREKAGDIPLSCRISADEFVDGGLTVSETKRIAQRLEEAGADVISVAAGTYASMAHMAPPADMGEGVHVHLAKAIKDATGVPVICVGNIWSLEYADRVIMENKADLVAICRQQIADPRFVKKSLNNQPFNKCTGCGTCIYFLRGANSVSCPQNPEL